jgi:membrane fusion protein (multidrug efflux system)
MKIRLLGLPSLGIALMGLAACTKAPPPAPPPPDVTVMTVLQKDVPVTEEWVADLHGMVDAQVRAQVSGNLLKQDYQEGSHVKAGDPLFEIDPRPFQAVLDQAQALLAQAQANEGKAAEDVKRYGPLAKEQAVSQQEYDDAVQAQLAAAAQIQAAKATVETATLNLSFTHIVSPVDGVAGLIQAQVGDLVGPGTGVLTTVSTIDPMRVYFPVGEGTYLALRRGHPEGDAFGPEVSLSLILADGSVYPEAGKFLAVDRQIDSNTGTIQVAAVFPNPKGTLRPGQYGRVRAVIRTEKDALLVPTKALSELQGGYQVAVVADGKVHIQVVKTGPTSGPYTVVESGLKPGDAIVVDGIQKVKEGSPVNAKPYQAAP